MGGRDTQKQEIREAVELPLTHFDLYKKIGIDPPRGVLLYGPLGTSNNYHLYLEFPCLIMRGHKGPGKRYSSKPLHIIPAPHLFTSLEVSSSKSVRVKGLIWSEMFSALPAKIPLLSSSLTRLTPLRRNDSTPKQVPTARSNVYYSSC